MASVDFVAFLPWLKWPLIFAAFYFGAVPLLITLTLKFRRHPTVVDAAGGVPEQVREFLAEDHEGLLRAGFEHAGDVACGDYVPNVVMIGGVYVHADGDAAINFFVTAAEGKTTARFLEFARAAEDDSLSVATGSSPDLGSFRPNPGGAWFRLPSVQDAEELAGHHREICRSLGPTGPLYPLGPATTETAIRVIAKALGDLLPVKERQGYLRPVEGGEYYKPRLFAGWLMVLKELPPMKQVRLALVRRHGKTLLAKLERGEAIVLDDATAYEPPS